jgi:DNA-binding MarR family transcriptional regulator
MVHIHHLRSTMKSTQNAVTDTGVVDEIARDCLLTRARQISRVITSIYDQEYRPYGVNAPQFSLLVLIARLGGASRAEIGRTNSQDRSTLTRNLQVLLSAGWVEELPREKDGRSRPIVISLTGRDLLVAVAPAWRSAQEKARPMLGADGEAAIVAAADQRRTVQVP